MGIEMKDNKPHAAKVGSLKPILERLKIINKHKPHDLYLKNSPYTFLSMKHLQLKKYPKADLLYKRTYVQYKMYIVT